MSIRDRGGIAAVMTVLGDDFSVWGHDIEGTGDDRQATYRYGCGTGSAWSDLAQDTNAEAIIAELRKVDAGEVHWRVDNVDIVVDVVSDAERDYTPAFVRYCELMVDLDRYPILDDDALSLATLDWANDNADDFLDEADELIAKGWDAVSEALSPYAPHCDDLDKEPLAEARMTVACLLAQEYIDNS